MRLSVPFTTLVFALISTVEAFNHPHIEWKTTETEHFRIHFSTETEPVLHAASRIAEKAYESLAPLYNYSLDEKIDLALADYDDYSNGLAAWLDPSIIVWVPDSRFSLRGKSTWLNDVITHEIAHILSLGKEDGMQLVSWNLVGSYMAENYSVTLGEPIPAMVFMPAWFAEGTAQMGSQRLGHDCWDSRRDMLLRCAVLENKQLSLEEMGQFTHGSLGNELVYNQGYSLTQHMERVYGTEKVSVLWKKSRDRQLFGKRFGRFVQNHLGEHSRTIYSDWLDSLKEYYPTQVPKTPTATSIIWAQGTGNQAPAVSPDGKWWGWLTNQRDAFGKTDLVIAPYGKRKPSIRIPYVKECWRFDPQKPAVYYVKSQKPDSNGSYLNDLFRYDLKTRKQRRLTQSARIYDFDISEDASRMIAVQFENGSFRLIQYDVSTGNIKPLIPGLPGNPFVSVTFSPTSSDTVVVSRVISGSSDLFKLSISEGVLRPLIADEAQQEDPHWAADGRIYFSADYDGIHNLYSVFADGTDLQRHTSAVGGFFQPHKGVNDTLLFSSYTADGFRIASCKLQSQPWDISDCSACRFDSLPTPPQKPSVQSRPYERELLRPIWQMNSLLLAYNTGENKKELPFYQSEQDWDKYFILGQTSLGLQRMDALGKKGMYLGANAQFIIHPELIDSVDREKVMEKLQSAGCSGADRRPKSSFRRAQSDYCHDLSFGHVYTARNDYAQIFDQTEDSTTSGDTLQIIPILTPYLGFMNAKHKATYGLDLQVQVTMIPSMLTLMPWVERQMSSEWWAGASAWVELNPLGLINPFNLLYGLELPFWITWQPRRYYNEDVEYNLADISQFSARIMPFLLRSQTKREGDRQTDDYGDTEKISDPEYENALNVHIGAYHGFRLFDYLSPNVRASVGTYLLEKKHAGLFDSLEGASSFYLYGSAGVGLKFPVMRNINRGRQYLDNMYASVDYGIRAFANEYFFEDLCLDDRYRFFYRQVISAGIELGMIKSYQFHRRFSILAKYFLGEQRVQLDVSFL
ncbi:MAG: TolB family protein [Chitinispirillaceae bacterium]